jgi:proteasome assembly chaperone (PAC2) family protein
MKTQGMNGHKDDQVSAMMVSIFCFYEELAVIHAEIETEHITEKPKSLEEFIAQQESMKAESSQFNKHNVYVALCN